MKERLRFGWKGDEHDVEYIETEHWSDVPTYSTGKPEKAYEVYVDGEHVGKVEQTEDQSVRPLGRGSRLVTRGGYRIRWSWRRLDGETNAPGLYCDTRREAVAHLIGDTHYYSIERVR